MEHRKQGRIPFSAFWEYYKENCENPLVKTEPEFELFFKQWLNPIFADRVTQKVAQYFDNKFNVTTISKGDTIIGIL